MYCASCVGPNKRRTETMTTTHVAQHQNIKLGRALQPLMFRDSGGVA